MPGGIGNVLRHDYHRVSDTVVWNVVQDRLHPLKVAMRRLMRGWTRVEARLICQYSAHDDHPHLSPPHGADLSTRPG
jgi:uncharacterized protein with HEPN domain